MSGSNSDQLLAREILDQLARLHDKQDKILEQTAILRTRVTDMEGEHAAMHDRLEEVEDFTSQAKSAGRVVMWLALAIAGVASFIATLWNMINGR